MESYSRAVEIAKDMVQQDKWTLDEAHVEIVRMVGVKLVQCRLPRDVRNAYNAAVKRGYLGHVKKERFKPEAYFHPNSRWRAEEERERVYVRSVKALFTVCVPHSSAAEALFGSGKAKEQEYEPAP